MLICICWFCMCLFVLICPYKMWKILCVALCFVSVYCLWCLYLCIFRFALMCVSSSCVQVITHTTYARGLYEYVLLLISLTGENSVGERHGPWLQQIEFGQIWKIQVWEVHQEFAWPDDRLASSVCGSPPIRPPSYPVPLPFRALHLVRALRALLC